MTLSRAFNRFHRFMAKRRRRRLRDAIPSLEDTFLRKSAHHHEGRELRDERRQLDEIGDFMENRKDSYYTATR